MKFTRFWYHCATILFLVQGTLSANLFETCNSVKQQLARFACKAQYYAPYIIVPAVGMVTGKILNKKLALAGIGAYIGGTTLDNMKTIYRIKKKYQRTEHSHDGWHRAAGQAPAFYFARWRQVNEGDGIYWTTAWQINEDSQQVKKKFLQDLYAGKFVVMNDEGELIPFPTPQQVLGAIRAELQELAKDKEALAPLTDVYYAFARPEEFCPDISYARLLWPNYNAASRLYIELDIMMKRLEKVLDIVAELRATVGGHGWPRITH